MNGVEMAVLLRDAEVRAVVGDVKAFSEFARHIVECRACGPVNAPFQLCAAGRVLKQAAR